MDTTCDSAPGTDVWGGPLSGGAYVFAALNRNPTGGAPASIPVRWAMLEIPGFDDTTAACVRELYNGTAYGVVTGGLTVTVPENDLAVLRVVPGATTC